METSGRLTLATTSSGATRGGAEGHAHWRAARSTTRAGRTIRIDPIASIAAAILATTLLLVSIPRMAVVPAPVAPPTPLAAPARVPAVAPAAEASAAPAPAPAPAQALLGD